MTFFDYFQIASVAFFVLTITIKTLYLLYNRGVNPIAIGGGKTGFALYIEILAFLTLLAWMIEIILYATHSSFHIFPAPLDLQLFESLVAKMTGAVLICAGFMIFSIAYISFGDSWRVGFDVKQPGALVTSGIFKWSRNPIYFSLDLWFVGIFLINGTLSFLILAVLAFWVQHWQILQEEKFLANLYGQPYLVYCSRTGRYFGRSRN
jgi:protein-S-isoprenylcysteine O-methyltransferase Ste14